LLLSGKPIKALDGVGWLIDYAGAMDDALKTAWTIATGKEHNIPKRDLNSGALSEIPKDVPGLPGTPARKAIVECVEAACKVDWVKALEVQATASGSFMETQHCQKGVVGQAEKKLMAV
jgi:hypothetical protein